MPSPRSRAIRGHQWVPSPGSRAAAACAARAPVPNRIHPWPLRAVPHCSERRRRGSRSPLLAARRSAGRGRCRRPRTFGSVGARTRARALPRASRSAATVQTRGLSPDREWGSHSALIDGNPSSSAPVAHQCPSAPISGELDGTRALQNEMQSHPICNPIQSAISSNLQNEMQSHPIYNPIQSHARGLLAELLAELLAWSLLCFSAEAAAPFDCFPRRGQPVESLPLALGPR